MHSKIDSGNVSMAGARLRYAIINLDWRDIFPRS